MANHGDEARRDSLEDSSEADRLASQASTRRSSSMDSGFDMEMKTSVRKASIMSCEEELLPENPREKLRKTKKFGCSSSTSTHFDLDDVRCELEENLPRTCRHFCTNKTEQISRTVSQESHADQWGTEISQPLSALYAILVVIISSCLAFSSQLTNNVDSMYSRYFDSSLLAIGVAFLASSFAYLYRKESAGAAKHGFLHSAVGSFTALYRTSSSDTTISHAPSGDFRLSRFSHNVTKVTGTKTKRVRVIHAQVDSASFYLKMGTLSFAIGSMIYACLELGVYVENTSCFNMVMVLNPILFIGFVVLQLYFVFLNSRLTLNTYRSIGRFGLMHLVATNLCIWIRTLIDETLHAFGKIHDDQIEGILTTRNHSIADTTPASDGSFVLPAHILTGNGGYNPLCVDDESVMKMMMEEASAFLYPCIIEYSLISAGILYIMWTFVGCEANGSDPKNSFVFRDKKAYAIDCDQSAKGLFVGIVVVVLTTVSLILYCLYLEKPSYLATAVFTAQLTEILLYGIGLVAVIYCFAKLTHNLDRSSRHTASRKLDETLLQISMMGVYSYSVMSILGGCAEDGVLGMLSVASSTLCLVQSTAQTIFIFDASQRNMGINGRESTNTMPTNKPARESITLLLIVNFAIWATNVFCTLRYESSPSQTEFYGTHEWTAMLHVTVPLVIFYRFHSTACLFEIWKRAYKEKRLAPTVNETLVKNWATSV